MVYAGNLAGDAACEKSLNGAFAAIESLTERQADPRM
jgi:hypothetical protein